MFGVNVAKSSLHLHFLKTLEFRTDVSVTIPTAAGASRWFLGDTENFCQP
uniref:Uncharacterized protein n=1 Tax=Phocoena sinus TaxID=42100 RepID=A0A8C9C4E8_PHOSS